MRKYLVAAGLAVIGLAGCYNDNTEDLYPKAPLGNCDTVDVTFTAKILPIFKQNCATAGCHSGSLPARGWDFNQYAGVKASVDAGRLLGAIKHLPGFVPMPQGGNRLSECDIRKIEIWVGAGAQNN
jgi:hypothetical protein